MDVQDLMTNLIYNMKSVPEYASLRCSGFNVQIPTIHLPTIDEHSFQGWSSFISSLDLSLHSTEANKDNAESKTVKDYSFINCIVFDMTFCTIWS